MARQVHRVMKDSHNLHDAPIIGAHAQYQEVAPLSTCTCDVQGEQALADVLANLHSDGLRTGRMQILDRGNKDASIGGRLARSESLDRPVDDVLEVVLRSL